MKKFVKRLIFIPLVLCICTFIFAVSYVSIVYISANVDFNLANITDKSLSVNMYDAENSPIKCVISNGEYISLELIPKHTINCFLSIEDKEFFSHDGINIKRMIAATAKNIITFSLKEGASTISQQLIKNTHLSNEKTLKRKINEIKLTKKLEKTLSKEQILEYYLNVIYFGDNCYGIQNASQHYFSHSASKLTLDESAMLAGIIKAPNKYHPVKNYQKSISRRNLVLSEMNKDGHISEQDFMLAKSKPTEINLCEIVSASPYSRSALLEAEEILKMPEKQIGLSGYKIYTYNSKEKQEAMNILSLTTDCNCAMISINPKTSGIEAYTEKATIPLINVKRQPASAIKPSLVYAPAINENIISPCSQILDDKVVIGNYSPKNIGGNYCGYTSAKNALSQSLNVPAVKILSYVGLDKAKAYLERQNISFDANDNSLALALGGMTYGLSLKELTNTYQTLANGGKYVNAKFIRYIADKNGKIVYKNPETQKQIYREDTAYLVTDMLVQSSKSGTAKRLSSLPYMVASKTGTSSKNGENLDAYNISYTSTDVVGCWLGNVDNAPISHVGGGTPTNIIKQYFSEIYKQKKPVDFKMPSSVTMQEIDLNALETEHCVYLAGDYLPERYRQKALFSKFNLPKTKQIDSISFSAPTIEGCVKNGVAEITFTANEYEIYDLYMVINNKPTKVDTISSKSGKTKFTYAMPHKQIIDFYVISKIKNYKTGTEIESNQSNVLQLYYK